MKKVIIIFLVLFIAVAFCACVNTDIPSVTTYNSSIDMTSETFITTVNTTSDVVTTTAISDTTNTTTAETTTATTVQTESEEEKALKARYEAAKSHLAEYVDKGSFVVEEEYKYGAAAKYLYDEFEALGDYKDCKEILTGFTVLPNMLTSITAKQTNPLGYEIETVYASYMYDENGNLKNNEGPFDLRILGFDDYSSVYANDYLNCEFDDAGKLVLANLIVREKTIAVITPEYDEKGNIVKVTTLGKKKTYTQAYEYDDQNRLISKSSETYYFDEYGNFSKMELITHYTYSYDENGRLVEETSKRPSSQYPVKTTYCYNDAGKVTEKTIWSVSSNNLIWHSSDYKNVVYNASRTTTYTYDENGNLTLESYLTNYTEYFYDDNGYLVKETEKLGEKFYDRVYVNDEEGKHISAEITETQNGEQISNPQTLTYNYETLYFYVAK